jgi:hypothetical protein
MPSIKLTRRVQTKCAQFKGKGEIAFKIVPRERICNGLIRAFGEDGVQDWGVLLPFSGGKLGATVVPVLATLATMDSVSSVAWEMPGWKGLRAFPLTSIIVKSYGEAESYGVDALLEMHAPELAERSRQAHVFHFHRKEDAVLFETLLSISIAEYLLSCN